MFCFIGEGKKCSVKNKRAAELHAGVGGLSGRHTERRRGWVSCRLVIIVEAAASIERAEGMFCSQLLLVKAVLAGKGDDAA